MQQERPAQLKARVLKLRHRYQAAASCQYLGCVCQLLVVLINDVTGGLVTVGVVVSRHCKTYLLGVSAKHCYSASCCHPIYVLLIEP